MVLHSRSHALVRANQPMTAGVVSPATPGIELRSGGCALRRSQLVDPWRARMDHQPERLVYTVEEAGRLLGVSRTTAYECVRTGQLPSVRLGRRIVVPRAAIEALLAGAGSDRP